MSSPRLSADARREQILDVAINVFGRAGYYGASMNDIADAAGVTKPVLYQHFDSKGELYSALLGDEIESASLDHAMWFHRPLRADEWLLYSQQSPSMAGARGLTNGLFYRRDGTLVASVVQEGLFRIRPR